MYKQTYANYHKAYYRKNKRRIIELYKKWYVKNLEKNREKNGVAAKKYYYKNREAILAEKAIKRAEYRALNPKPLRVKLTKEEIKKLRHERYSRERAEVLIQQKQYNKIHREQLNKNRRQWYKKNKEQLLKNSAEWRRKNPEKSRAAGCRIRFVEEIMAYMKKRQEERLAK